jgi:hypothetical protein
MVDATDAIDVAESMKSSGAAKKSSRSKNHGVAEVDATKSSMKKSRSPRALLRVLRRSSGRLRQYIIATIRGEVVVEPPSVRFLLVMPVLVFVEIRVYVRASGY